MVFSILRCWFRFLHDFSHNHKRHSSLSNTTKISDIFFSIFTDIYLETVTIFRITSPATLFFVATEIKPNFFSRIIVLGKSMPCNLSLQSLVYPAIFSSSNKQPCCSGLVCLPSTDRNYTNKCFGSVPEQIFTEVGESTGALLSGARSCGEKCRGLPSFLFSFCVYRGTEHPSSQAVIIHSTAVMHRRREATMKMNWRWCFNLCTW